MNKRVLLAHQGSALWVAFTVEEIAEDGVSLCVFELITTTWCGLVSEKMTVPASAIEAMGDDEAHKMVLAELHKLVNAHSMDMMQHMLVQNQQIDTVKMPADVVLFANRRSVSPAMLTKDELAERGCVVLPTRSRRGTKVG